MRYGRYGWSYFLLRLGLGLVFTWIGVDIVRHPETWLGYVPPELPLGISREQGLHLSGLFDVIIGGLLMIDKLPKIAATLTALHLLGILVTQGINAIIIRDVGLLGAAIALLVWPHHRHKHILGQYFFFWRRRREFED